MRKRNFVILVLPLVWSACCAMPFGDVTTETTSADPVVTPYPDTRKFIISDISSVNEEIKELMKKTNMSFDAIRHQQNELRNSRNDSTIRNDINRYELLPSTAQPVPTAKQ